MMRDQIKFGMVRTAAELEELKVFAKTFNHKVGRDSIMPIYTGRCGDKLIGYFNLILYPIVCPAIHPVECSQRAFFDCIEYLKHHFCLESISDQFPFGMCFLALPQDMPINKKEAVERCGFRNTKKEIWQCIP